MDITQIIKKPVITEKGARGEPMNKFTFVVDKGATKIDIKRAIKEIYGMKVLKVNSTKVLEKGRIVGGRKYMKKRSEGKKVTITIEKGKKFDFTKVKEAK
ncbi:MAG: 50S ribosomal protein L25, large subunit ribosomal protein L23 [Candidatus Peregrinibacteria bacterium GW2011_GWF2_43_17]|nr:MAG: 50S ribosomal protein L25, large subunit ribosomal protein L23 [Candidatus Peregrinibacteria bacterium GW2011_GWF2_43_17]KKT19312.1 MAG: 50S ribosomal protein L23 [Candidatus Peregrinibacteria bacterium GW2011_GWA2_43_8]HAU40179.1 50S ribosomal protein L23 [Candidatus Peregrinibacteria bacterium]